MKNITLPSLSSLFIQPCTPTLLLAFLYLLDGSVNVVLQPFPMFSSDILKYDYYQVPEISWLGSGSKERVQELVPTDTILLEAIMTMAEQSGQLN